MGFIGGCVEVGGGAGTSAAAIYDRCRFCRCLCPRQGQQEGPDMGTMWEVLVLGVGGVPFTVGIFKGQE